MLDELPEAAVVFSSLFVFVFLARNINTALPRI